MAFDGTGSEHNVGRPQGPEALAWQPGRWASEVIGDPFEQPGGAVVVKTKRDSAGHDAHAGLLQGRDLISQGSRSAWLRQAVATTDGILFDQHHVQARLSSSPGGSTASRAAADHQQVTVAVGMFVVVGVWGPRSLAHTCRPADNFFVAHPHAGTGAPLERWHTHKSLIVKAGGKKSAQQAI